MFCTACHEYGTTYFLIRKTILYFKYMDFSTTYQSTPLSSSYQNRHNFKRNAVSKKNSTHSEATKTKWHRLYPSLTQIEMTMHAPVLVQQFTHVVYEVLSQSLSLPFVTASENFGHGRKSTTKEKYETDKQRKAQRNPFSTESKASSITLLDRIACFAQSKPSLVVAGQSAVSQTPRERRLVLSKSLLCR